MTRRPTVPATKPKRRTRRRSGKGVLTLVTLMLAASGFLRFADGPGQVLAKEVDGLVKPNGPLPDLASGGANCAPPPDIAAVLAAMDQRDSRLAEREAALADRLAAVSLAEAEIRKNMVALEAAEARLAKLVALSEDAAENDLKSLTAVYEAMKPKEAAALFEQMAPEFAAGFIGRMRADIAAAIMAGLTPETAYSVSAILAGRNTSAPAQ